MAQKAKIYKIDKNKKSEDKAVTQFIVGIVVYALVIEIASSLFKGIEVYNFFYAIIAALILSILNYYLKPILEFLTLPLNILTLGITYPIINVIILEICDLIMGSAFEVNGFLNVFIIAIFISLLRMFLDEMITKKI